MEHPAKDTYDNLLAARTPLGGAGPIVPWKVISSYVDRFNRANDDNDNKAKNAALADMRTAMRDYTAEEQEQLKNQSESK